MASSAPNSNNQTSASSSVSNTAFKYQQDCFTRAFISSYRITKWMCSLGSGFIKLITFSISSRIFFSEIGFKNNNSE